MGELSTDSDAEAVDVIADAIEGEFPTPKAAEPKEETKEEPKPTESKAPAASKKDEEKPANLEETDLSEEPAVEEPEDRLRNFRDKLKAAGLENQAEQAERWYNSDKAKDVELAELQKYREEHAAQEAETAKRRSEADSIIENAPPDLKAQWGQYRQENGDRSLLSAHNRYMERLRKESPDDFEKEQSAAKLRKLEQDLEDERNTRVQLEKDRAQREFNIERDSTLRSLQVDPKEFESYQERVKGVYVTQYMKLEAEKGHDAAEALQVSEVVKQFVAEQKEAREALKKVLREELIEEARDTKKKKAPKRRAEEPVKTPGRRAKDIDDEAEATMRDAITESMERK